MKIKAFLLIFSFLCLISINAMAESVILSWDAADGATGYKLQMTTDGGASWEDRDIGAATRYEWKDVPMGVKVE